MEINYYKYVIALRIFDGKYEKGYDVRIS